MYKVIDKKYNYNRLANTIICQLHLFYAVSTCSEVILRYSSMIFIGYICR